MSRPAHAKTSAVHAAPLRRQAPSRYLLATHHAPMWIDKLPVWRKRLFHRTL